MSSEPKWTADRVDFLLKALDPVRQSSLTSARIESALDEIGSAITSWSRPEPRATWRRWIRGPRALILVGAVVVAISAGVATGAVVLGARTGLFPTKAEQVMGGPGEALNPSAPDFRDVALQVGSDVPYPAGYESWRDFLISDEIRTTGTDGLVSSGALHGLFAASAFTAWVQAWRKAEFAGDSVGASHAARVISEAPGWKAVTDEDPHPDPSVRGDAGSTQSTLFGWMLPYRDAVLAGDRARVEQLLATHYGDKVWTSDPAWRAQLAAHREWGTLSQSEMADKYEQFLAGGHS